MTLLETSLAMVEKEGCACNRLFEGLCLVHYAELMQPEDDHSPGAGADPGLRGDDRRDRHRSAKAVRKPGRKRPN